MTLQPKFSSWSHSEGGLSYDLENVYLTITCSESQAAELTGAIRPSLKKFGGMCLVSDAMWVIHET